MQTVWTNEKDARFLKLVDELDAGYYERIGDDLSKYDSYNEFTKPHVVILLLNNNEPAACASYRTCNETSVEFKRVYVKREFRKQGIAYNLLIQLEEDIIKKGFLNSFIVTGKNNFAAIKLYEKLDYMQIPKFGQFKDDESVVCMKKEFR